MKYNKQLRDELLSMQEEDQRLLQNLIDSGELGTTEYHPRMKEIHEKNNARIKEIISDYGWPGFSLVGKEGSKSAWLIVQHAVLDVRFMGTGTFELKIITEIYLLLVIHWATRMRCCKSTKSHNRVNALGRKKAIFLRHSAFTHSDLQHWMSSLESIPMIVMRERITAYDW